MGGVMMRRTRRFLASVAITAAAVAIAAPAAMAQQFHGGGYLTNYSRCDQIGVGANHVSAVTARYEPGELAEDGSSSVTIYEGSSYSFNLFSEGEVFQDTFALVRGRHMIPTDVRMLPNPRVRLVGQIPAVITENTDRVRLRLRVWNMYGVRRCVASAELELVRR